jgi:hypothetical protein
VEKQARRISKEQAERADSTRCLLQPGFLDDLLFYPEDGADMFLRNVGSLKPDHAALYLKGWNSSSFG